MTLTARTQQQITEAVWAAVGRGLGLWIRPQTPMELQADLCHLVHRYIEHAGLARLSRNLNGQPEIARADLTQIMHNVISMYAATFLEIAPGLRTWADDEAAIRGVLIEMLHEATRRTATQQLAATNLCYN